MSPLKDRDMRYGFAVMKAMRKWRKAGCPVVVKVDHRPLPGYLWCGACGLKPLTDFSASGVRNKRCRQCVKAHNAQYIAQRATATVPACPSSE